MTRVLVFYIVQDSGHHAAARYLAGALLRQTPGMEVRCVDLLQHTHPRWSRAIQRMYMTTVRRTPELWEALYDNFWVEFLSRRLRPMIQKGRSESLRRLMDEFDPHAVVCTQAYPFAVMASFAARHNPALPLFAVATDFVPHRFWVIPGAQHAAYVVATELAAERMMWLGIAPERMHVLGIPVSVELPAAQPPDPADGNHPPCILVMGGSRGLGVRYRTIQRLDQCPDEFGIDVVCGTNRSLRRKLVLNRRRFKHPLRIRGYVNEAVSLMSRADLMITKAGGLTMAEAACVGVPLLLVRPLPGQEMGNAEVMVRYGAALRATSEKDVPRYVSMLLNNPALRQRMRERALAMARPDAADRVARLVLAAATRSPP